MTRAIRLTCLPCCWSCGRRVVAVAKPAIAVLGLEVVDKSGAPTPNDDVSSRRS